MQIEKLDEMNVFIDRYLFSKKIFVMMTDLLKSNENLEKKNLEVEWMLF